jgi:hypothetical protein
MMNVEVFDTDSSEYCTKCGSKLEKGENILVNRCIGKSCSEEEEYINKEHRYCKGICECEGLTQEQIEKEDGEIKEIKGLSTTCSVFEKYWEED